MRTVLNLLLFQRARNNIKLNDLGVLRPAVDQPVGASNQHEARDRTEYARLRCFDAAMKG
jgi:hypothetical protein